MVLTVTLQRFEGSVQKCWALFDIDRGRGDSGHAAVRPHSRGLLWTLAFPFPIEGWEEMLGTTASNSEPELLSAVEV